MALPPHQEPTDRSQDAKPDGRYRTVLLAGAAMVGMGLVGMVALPTVSAQRYVGPLFFVGLVIFIVGATLHLRSLPASERWAWAAKQQQPERTVKAPQPLAYTPEGQPIYPVVGYTPDGQPVTADRAIGYQPSNVHHTNTLAIVTFVVSLVFSIFAIPLGHIALRQISRTGEQGRGLAIAGLVIGYLGLIGLVSVGIIIASR